MSNNCCCTSIYNAGCIGHCDGLTVSGLEGETITVQIESGHRQWKQTLAIVEGSATITKFNEEALHIVKFPEPIEIEGETYDCIKVKTEINTSSQPSGGGGSQPTTFCQDVQACMAGFTPESPAVQAPATILIQNTTFNLQGFNLNFKGNQLDGNQLERDFDSNGNDWGGYSNTIGSDSFFNSIRGFGNTNGDENLFNTLIGAGNTVGNDSRLNFIIAANNTIGENTAGVGIFGSDNTVGDNVDICYLLGDEHVIQDGVNYSAAWGIGHNITCNLSYMFGRWGVCPEGGLAIGNGTDNLNRNNSHLLKDNGSYQHDGAYGNKPTHFTTGGNATIPNNVGTWVYDPVSLQATATIQLPSTPFDGQRLVILAGGTITSGTVVTALILDGNGNGIVGTVAASLEVGLLEFVFSSLVNAWYIR